MARKRDFGAWLKRTLVDQQLTGRELAKQLNVSESAVSRWVSGDQVPTLKVLGRIATALDIEPLSVYVRAGKLSEEETGVPPAPLPPPHHDRDQFEKMFIQHVPGVSTENVQRIMEAYDSIIRKESERT